MLAERLLMEGFLIQFPRLTHAVFLQPDLQQAFGCP